MGVSKSFGTNITENHIHKLSALFFGQALDKMGQKCRYLAQGGITCGTIDEPRKSSKAIDERVIINFRDKNVVIVRFRVSIAIFFYR